MPHVTSGSRGGVGIAASITLTPQQELAAKAIAEYMSSKDIGDAFSGRKTIAPPPIVPWMENSFYIVETEQPIELERFQKAIIEFALDPANEFTTIIYSAIKKSGKSAIAAAIARYLAETSGHRAEVLCVANDKEQARGRSYQSVLSSIELDPRYESATKSIPNYWRIIEKHAIHLPSNSVIRAIANDNKGEAGANPVASVWTELWGYTSPSSLKLFAELTPVNTRKRSIRLIETYAGYEDESTLLLEQFELGMKGRRLTHDDIDWPFPDQPPIWVNKAARLFMYWDSGRVARRMPWQQDEAYYIAQAASLPEHEYLRLHENKWQSSKNEFIRPEWWSSCQENDLAPLGKNEPCVLGADGSVSGDTTAISLVSRHPDPARRGTDVVVRRGRVWYPAANGGVIDLQEVEDTIRAWCKEYRVVQVAYDAFQMHQMMTNIMKDAICWTYSFGQHSPRNVADKSLYDLIIRRGISHDGDPELDKQMRNAAMKNTADADERMRIVKKRKDTPVDYVVATSMAAHEILRLNV